MIEVRAEMAANVWKTATETGSTVAAGDTLVILESMKMEIPIESPASGTARLHVTEGESIQEHQLIATIEEREQRSVPS